MLNSNVVPCPLCSHVKPKTVLAACRRCCGAGYVLRLRFSLPVVFAHDADVDGAWWTRMVVLHQAPLAGKAQVIGIADTGRPIDLVLGHEHVQRLGQVDQVEALSWQ